MQKKAGRGGDRVPGLKNTWSGHGWDGKETETQRERERDRDEQQRNGMLDGAIVP